jgi:acyl carrier protein
MSSGTGDSVKSMILTRLEQPIIQMGFEPSAIADDFDLLTSGVIDSLGIVELISAIEQELHTAIDLSELDPENLTIIGPLSRYIETQYFQTMQVRKSA